MLSALQTNTQTANLAENRAAPLGTVWKTPLLPRILAKPEHLQYWLRQCLLGIEWLDMSGIITIVFAALENVTVDIQ